MAGLTDVTLSDSAILVRSDSRIYPRVPLTVQELLIAGAALSLASIGVAIDLSSGVLRSPETFALLVIWMTCAMVLVGLTWRRSRPQSRMGSVLIATGFLCALQLLQGSNVPLLFTVGLVADPVVFVALIFVYVSYPRAQLDDTGRLVLVLAVGLALLIPLSWALMSATAVPQGPFAACAGTCPQNLLAIGGGDSTSRSVTVAIDIGRVAFALCFIVAMAARWRVASRPRRRALGPVIFLGVVTMLAFGLFGLMRAALGTVPLTVGLGALMTLAREALPLAILGGLVAASRFAVDALEDVVGHLGPGGQSTTLERAVAMALDDPGLRLYFRTDDGRWADDVGATASPAVPTRGRARLSVADADEVVAVVDHDEELDGDPELLRAAARVILHDREHVLMTTRLAETVEELSAMQRRLAVAGLEERRRLERDLHDGAQQSLLALRIQMNLLRDHTTDPAVATRLTELGQDTDETISELRRIARGVYPPLLTDGGLVEAVRSVVRRTPGAQLEATGIDRYDPDLEAALYFCIVEAMQNATRYSGPDVKIAVRIHSDGRALGFAVVDDGPGFDASTPRSGSGLTNLTDRLAQAGGTLDIGSAPGRGTTIRGSIPIGGPTEQPAL